MSDLITTRKTPNTSDSTAVTMLKGLTLEDYISQHIHEKLQEHTKKLKEQIQEVRHSVTDSINTQIQTLRQETTIPVLRQRAETLAPQLIKLKKQIKAHNNAKTLTGTASAEWLEDKTDLCDEHQRLQRIYHNIVHEGHQLHLTPEELGLPDFPQGPA
jgi:chromosome segregation ATPase